MRSSSIMRTILAGALLLFSIGLLIFAIIHFAGKKDDATTAKNNGTSATQKVQQEAKNNKPSTPAPKPDTKKTDTPKTTPAPSTDSSKDKTTTDKSKDTNASGNKDVATAPAAPAPSTAPKADSDSSSDGGTGADSQADSEDLAKTGPADAIWVFLAATTLGTLLSKGYGSLLQRNLQK